MDPTMKDPLIFALMQWRNLPTPEVAVKIRDALDARYTGAAISGLREELAQLKTEGAATKALLDQRSAQLDEALAEIVRLKGERA